MMSSYQYNSFHLNNREVSISAVMADKVAGGSAFERDTITFIKGWLSGEQHFTLQTSGSTGPPKTIIATRQMMEHSARLTRQALDLREGMTAFICLPTTYIAGKMMLIRALTTNIKIVACEPSSNPLKHAGIHQKDFAAFVPMQLQTMIDDGYTSELNQLKKIIVGGAPVSSALFKAIKNLSVPVYETYGMTETVSHVALKHLNGHEHKPCFCPLAGVKLFTDARGCLVIDAPYLPDQVVTNDLVMLNNDGSFQWRGRYDHIINSGGVKILPEVVEDALVPVFEEFSIQQRFFISGKADALLGEKVVLFIEGNALPPHVEKNLLDSVKSTLTSYEAPKEIKYLKKFTETKSGKISRFNRY